MDIYGQNLARLLREAQEAHHEYEKELGHPDAAWAEWYAAFIAERLEKSA